MSTSTMLWTARECILRLLFNPSTLLRFCTISRLRFYSSVESVDSYYTVSENELGEVEVHVETSGASE